MKGLTLWEPWASLMAHGYKKNETRSWPTGYRGPLVIHAAKTQDHISDFKLLLAKAGIIESMFAPAPNGFPVKDHEWPFGKIIAVCSLVDCIPTDDLVKNGLAHMERACGDYSSARFAWIAEGLYRVNPPIPWRGKQALWDVPEELVQQLTRQ